MIYKKYVIEVSYVMPVLSGNRLRNGYTNSDTTASITIDQEFASVVNTCYMNKYGYLYSTNDYIFEKYKDAYDCLNNYYHTAVSTYGDDLRCIKIVEIYDDVTPSIKTLRLLKLQKINKK